MESAPFSKVALVSKVLPDYIDVRQSALWSRYLELLGWKSHKLSNGFSVQYRALLGGSLVKLQRPKKLTKECIKELNDFCISIHTLFCKVECINPEDTQLLKDADFEVSTFPLVPTSTMLLNLTLSEKELWQNVSHSGKYAINRAKRESTHTEIINKPTYAQMQNFYKILKYTGSTKNFYVPPFEHAYTQIEAFGEKSFIVNVYSSKDVVAGSKLYVADGNYVLYVSGGTTEEGRKNKAGFQLMWDSILYFKHLGYEVLDLEGVYDARFPSYTKHWDGFTEFKEKFGGVRLEFPFPMVKYFNPFLKLVAKYTFFRF